MAASFYRQDGDGIVLYVRLTPRASRDAVEGLERTDDGQVHLGRHIGHAVVGVDAQDVVSFGIDGIDGAAEGIADQVPEQRAADAAFLLTRADDGDVARGKDCVQRMPAKSGFIAKHGHSCQSVLFYTAQIPRRKFVVAITDPLCRAIAAGICACPFA